MGGFLAYLFLVAAYAGSVWLMARGGERRRGAAGAPDGYRIRVADAGLPGDVSRAARG